MPEIWQDKPENRSWPDIDLYIRSRSIYLHDMSYDMKSRLLVKQDLDLNNYTLTILLDKQISNHNHDKHNQ